MPKSGRNKPYNQYTAKTNINVRHLLHFLLIDDLFMYKHFF